MKSTDIVFIDVDTQRDFCDPEGALYVKGAPVETFRRLTKLAVEKRIPIVGSVDSHDPDAWEFASNSNVGPKGEDPRFPDHCIKGTPGWLKMEGTAPARSWMIPSEVADFVDCANVAWVLNDRTIEAIYLEKEVYSLFVNPAASYLLRSLSCKIAVIYGVATDYCVKAAALELCEWPTLERILVLTDAIAGVTPEGTEAAMAEMLGSGVEFMTTDELLEEMR